MLTRNGRGRKGPGSLWQGCRALPGWPGPGLGRDHHRTQATECGPQAGQLRVIGVDASPDGSQPAGGVTTGGHRPMDRSGDRGRVLVRERDRRGHNLPGYPLGEHRNRTDERRVG